MALTNCTDVASINLQRRIGGAEHLHVAHIGSYSLVRLILQMGGERGENEDVSANTTRCVWWEFFPYL